MAGFIRVPVFRRFFGMVLNTTDKEGLKREV